MTQHDTCTHLLIVSLMSVSNVSCQLSKFCVRMTTQVRSNVIENHSDLSPYFQYDREKSIHGRSSWELAPYDCSSQLILKILKKIEDFVTWCKLVSKECRFNNHAGECRVVCFTTQFFILDEAKALPITIWSKNTIIQIIMGETQ